MSRMPKRWNDALEGMSHWETRSNYWREPTLAGHDFPGLENIQAWCDLLLLASNSASGSELEVRRWVTFVGRSIEEPMSTGNRLNSLTSGASSNRELCKISLQDHSTTAINLRIRKCGGGDLQKSLFKYSFYNQFFYKEASLAYRQQACCKCVGVC